MSLGFGPDGASQMGLEDIATLRVVRSGTVFYPAGAISAERLTAQAPSTWGVVQRWTGYSSAAMTSSPLAATACSNASMCPISCSDTCSN